MSGALWFYNWDWGGTPSASTSSGASVSVGPIIMPGPDLDTHGARGFDYQPLPDEYWADREGRMTQDHDHTREVVFNPPELHAWVDKEVSGIEEKVDSTITGTRDDLVNSLKNAESVDSLKAIAAAIRKLKQ